MDFSFILVIGLAAVLTSALMIFSEITSRRGSTFRLAFGISYLLSFALMQPWRVTSGQEAGLSAMMLIFMALWVAIGCVIGALPTGLILSLVKWTAGLLRKRT